MTPSTSFVAALARLLDRPLSWSDISLLRNFGSLPLDVPVSEGAETRGFHARVLNPEGRCTHYVKCRSSSSTHAAREAMVLTALQRHPALVGLVPTARVMPLPGLRALVLGVVDGPGFALRVAGAPLADAIADTRRCLAVRRVILTEAQEVNALHGGGARLQALESLEPSLHILGESGVSAQDLATIRSLMATELPSAPQHGDFTPANIIWSATGPVVLDFEFFGLISPPLYDVWHFIRNARVQRGEARAWMGVVAPRDRRDRAWREVLDEESRQDGLSEPQRLASLVWYLSHIAALLIARKNSEEYSRPYLEDLARAVRFASS